MNVSSTTPHVPRRKSFVPKVWIRGSAIQGASDEASISGTLYIHMHSLITVMYMFSDNPRKCDGYWPGQGKDKRVMFACRVLLGDIKVSKVFVYSIVSVLTTLHTYRCTLQVSVTSHW